MQTSKHTCCQRRVGWILCIYMVFLGPQREQDKAHVFCVLLGTPKIEA